VHGRESVFAFKDFRWDGCSLVRALEDQSSDHGCVAGMGIRKIEAVHDLVDERSLG
jgi:hypothetical protein